jgi:hypothetical protein
VHLENRSERGAALVLVLAAVVLLTTLGTSLVLVVTTEARIAAGYRDGVQALHAAEAALERVMLDLAADDWAALLAAPPPADADEPGWHLCRDAWLHELIPGVSPRVRMRVTVWVRDEPPEGDGVLLLRARADGPSNARRVIEATVARDGAGLRMLWWREWR